MDGSKGGLVLSSPLQEPSDDEYNKRNFTPVEVLYVNKILILEIIQKCYIFCCLMCEHLGVFLPFLSNELIARSISDIFADI